MEDLIVCVLFVSIVILWGVSKPPSTLDLAEPPQEESSYINYFPEVELEEEEESREEIEEPQLTLTVMPPKVFELTAKELRTKAASLGVKQHYKLSKAQLAQEIWRLDPEYLSA